jgi:hypothetical protein
VDEKPDLYIIIRGNPVDGFEHFGPFPTRPYAEATGEENFEPGEYWIASLCRSLEE